MFNYLSDFRLNLVNGDGGHLLQPPQNFVIDFDASVGWRCMQCTSTVAAVRGAR